MDSWNPHASWPSFKLYLALCAEEGVFPSQVDFVQAYVQTPMRGERVFVKCPEYWRDLVPEELKKYMGRPLLLLKALYGYTFSGKFLYEDQAEFLQSQGLEPMTGMPALWIRFLSTGLRHIVLQYSDDFLSACGDTAYHHAFKSALASRFQVQWQDRADWYLQARIQQDKHGNILMDQQ